jgi:SAM-dependent methyltransferase
MERFWDARAREDPFFFVDSRLEYGAPEVESFWRGGERALDGLLQAVGAEISSEQVVVDIGCGIGRLTRALARRAARVIAIDVSSAMLAEARRLNAGIENVEWLHGDGKTLHPIANASVDACVSHVVFRHIPDPAITLGYLREMGRVLRPGGFAAVEFSNDPAAHRRRPRLRARLAAIAGRGPRGLAAAAWLGSYVDLADVSRVGAAAGLDVERVAGESTQFCATLLRRLEQEPSS